MIRRDFLRQTALAGALIALTQAETAPASAAQLTDASGTDDLGRLNSHLWQAFNLSSTKTAALPMVREQLRHLTGRLQSASGAEQRQVCALIADLFQLAGEIFFDANRYADAAHCYSSAASAGREASAYDVWACSLTRHAYISIQERRFADAAPVLAAAAELATRGDPQLSTRYWVAVVQAETSAGLGHLDDCLRHLDQAENVHDLKGPIHNGGWLRFDGSRLVEERGRCFVQLERGDLAESALAPALEGPLSPRRRGSVLVDLAELAAQRRDLDRALHYGNDACDLARRTGSGYVARRLRALPDRLEPYHANPQARQLLDSIASLA